MPEIESKLKNLLFAEFFLELDGLQFLLKIISPLPSGDLPLSNMRKRVLIVIRSLPLTITNIENAGLQTVLESLKNHNKEMKENITIIKEIQKKIAYMSMGNEGDYKNLENEEDFLEETALIKRNRIVTHNYQDNAAMFRKHRKSYVFLKRPKSTVDYLVSKKPELVS